MKRIEECLKGKTENYILPFFWQHGEDDETLIREIDAIEASGIRALCVESRTHEEFCEDGWWHTMNTILTECEKRGMKVWILDDKHFPSGYANGIIAKKYPEARMWGMTEHHMDVVGPQKNASVLFQWKTSPEDKLLAIVACKRVPGEETLLTGETIDLTDCLYDDMVYFDVPEGAWRIVYVLRTRSGLNGQFINYADKLTDVGGDIFIEAVYEPHWEHLGAHFGKTLAGFFSDEPCFGNNTHANMYGNTQLGRKYTHYPYADAVMDDLKKLYGDNAATLLPFLWFDSADSTSAKVRISYMDSITLLYRENFSYKLGNWCRAHGVEYIGHVIEDDGQHLMTGAGAGHFFRALDGQDMAGIDVVLCQIVPGMTDTRITVPCSYDTADPEFFHFMLAKLASSHAHIQPEKKGRAMCEIYGAYGWAEGLKMMKWLTDFMLVRGINYYVPHAFTPKFPDGDCPPHFFANGTNPQYARFRLLMEYMNRVCHITNHASHVASAAVLYQAEAYWSGHDFMRTETVARYLTEHQLDYDIVPSDRLYDASCTNGTLKIGDAEFPCLIVPYTEYLPKAVEDAIARIAKQVPVYYVTAVSSADTEKGVVCGAACGAAMLTLDALGDTLHQIGAADVTVVDGNEAVRMMRYYHCKNKETQEYLFTNEGIHETVRAKVRLSALDGTNGVQNIVLYDAMENRAVSAKTEADGTLVLELPPYTSVIVSVGIDTNGLQNTEVLPMAEKDTLVTSYPLDLSWDIFTATQEEYPIFSPYRSATTLFNMTGRDALPHFSGHMQYETTFEMEQPLADMHIILDLGEVGESVTVLVNGVRVGEKITPPYRFDITKAVRRGSNTLLAEVTNHYGYQMRDGFSKFLMFEPSGLLGPVTMEIRRTMTE
ncbi:MAG: glycosyl transferase family 2 [Clostridia bacterium]|nr:glycosyl transferase family 2 [Clostridia bacterium]